MHYFKNCTKPETIGSPFTCNTCYSIYRLEYDEITASYKEEGYFNCSCGNLLLKWNLRNEPSLISIQYLFGNWSIEDNNIVWNNPNNGNTDYSISHDILLKILHDKYDWLTHLSTKTWILEKDLNYFNEAFLKLAELNNLHVDKKIYSSSIEYQKNKLKTKV